MTTAQPPSAGIFRFLARAIVILYTLVAALVALTIAFPTWGMDPNHDGCVDCIIFIPPQGVAAFFILAFGLFLGTVTGLTGLVHSLIRHRGNWAVGFLAALAFGLLGPLLLAMGINNLGSAATTQAVETLAGIASSIAFLALPVLALVYTRRLRGPSGGAAHRR